MGVFLGVWGFRSEDMEGRVAIERKGLVDAIMVYGPFAISFERREEVKVSERSKVILIGTCT